MILEDGNIYLIFYFLHIREVLLDLFLSNYPSIEGLSLNFRAQLNIILHLINNISNCMLVNQ